jgi:hypothetical protein
MAFCDSCNTTGTERSVCKHSEERPANTLASLVGDRGKGSNVSWDLGDRAQILAQQ